MKKKNKKQDSFLPTEYKIPKIKKVIQIVSDEQLEEIEKSYPPLTEWQLEQFNKIK
jgi:hypothetical protein